MTNHDTPKTGFKNPPEHTRFKMGKSGNPQGRPRKPKDLNTVLQRHCHVNSTIGRTTVNCI